MLHVVGLLFFARVTLTWSVQTALRSLPIRAGAAWRSMPIRVRAGAAQDQETNVTSASSAQVTNHTLRVHTFNTALTRLNLPQSFDVRRRELATMLNDVEDDVICLQEVWDRNDMEDLSGMLSQKFPYQVLGSIAEVTEADMGSCLPLPLGMAMRIMFAWMRYGPDAALHDDNDVRHHPCSRCAAAYMFQAGGVEASMSKFLHAIRFCSTRRVLFPANGSSGVMVLSKRKISQSRETTLPHAILHRTAVDVLIEGLWIRCTHLSIFPEENSLGMKQILDNSSAAVVLGDLNSGLADPKHFITGYNEDAMKLVSKMGFVDVVSGCTWCSEGTGHLDHAGRRNELVATWMKNASLDHILIRNSSGVRARNVRKTFTFKDLSMNESDTWFSLSDHIGVSAELSWEGSTS